MVLSHRYSYLDNIVSLGEIKDFCRILWIHDSVIPTLYTIPIHKFIQLMGYGLIEWITITQRSRYEMGNM